LSQKNCYKIQIVGGRHDLERTLDLIHFVISHHGAEESESDVIAMAVGEACHNAIHHSDQEPDEVVFNLTLELDSDVCTAAVINQGEEFNMIDVGPFKQDQDFSVYSQGGLGVAMMKKLMDEVTCERQGNRINFVTLKKRITTKSTTNKGEATDEN